jgi:hypothetical protein
MYGHQSRAVAHECFSDSPPHNLAKTAEIQSSQRRGRCVAPTNFTLSAIAIFLARRRGHEDTFAETHPSAYYEPVQIV